MESTKKDANSLAISVANHVTAILAYWDKALICRFANNAYQDWFGRSNQEMIGITLEELLGPMYDSNSPYIKGALAGEIQTFEREIITPKGEKRYALAHYFPDIEDGEVKGFFVQGADITALKTLENKLIESNEINTDQNKRLLNFANTVSHNLRAYANNFERIIGMLNNPAYAEVKEEAMTHLEKLSKGFSSTIQNLNEISTVQNRTEIATQEINLNNYVAKAIDILNVQISTNKAFVFNKVSAGTKIWGDPAFMESILLNLLSNALKYRHPERDPLIVFECYVEGDRQFLKIHDNGIGIDLDTYGKDLFGMYKTFHGNADAQGIGLYITKYQIEQMLGKITVQSTLGEGTCFLLDFPIKENTSVNA
jgi:PAS domain S-box-containing protein